MTEAPSASTTAGWHRCAMSRWEAMRVRILMTVVAIGLFILVVWLDVLDLGLVR